MRVELLDSLFALELHRGIESHVRGQVGARHAVVGVPVAALLRLFVGVLLLFLLSGHYIYS